MNLDFTLCPGGDCPMKDVCYRYTAKPSGNWQVYFDAPPFVGGDCDYFVFKFPKEEKEMPLPKEAEDRKKYPVATGVLDYFPDAIVEIAHVSKVGNDQHNPGQPLHWAREKSTDHPDAMIRHFLERGTLDSDGVRHTAKMAWRALAMLQLEIERDRK